MLIDSHCHLDHKNMSQPIEDVVARAHEAGVSHLMTIATTLDEFKGVLQIAEKFPHVFASLGVHPYEASAQNPSYEQLLPFYDHPKVIGVGECGYDFKHFDPMKDFKNQRALFLTQIRLAQELQKPLVIHTREAEEQTRDILRSEMKNKPFKAILHCFTGSWELAKDALDLGLYISASGVITFKKLEDVRETFKKIPMDRLLVETDAPFLTPGPFRGKQVCEPMHVVHTAKKLAAIKGVSFEQISEQTTLNFKTLFSLASL